MYRILLLILLLFFSSCSGVFTKILDDNAVDEDAENVDESGDFDDSDIDEDTNDTDADVEMCSEDLTKEEWETEEWKKADDDKDGIPNGYECTKCPCEDYGCDDNPNYIDEDSDFDGISDAEECPDYSEENGCKDTDGDERPDYVDRDSDGDMLTDEYEYEEVGSDPYKKDTDGDGDDDLTEVICNETDPLNPEDHSIIPTICTSGCNSRKSVKIELTFNVGPREQTDITFLIDATNSMEDSVDNLKTEINALIDEKLSKINAAPDTLSLGLVQVPYRAILPQTKDSDQFKTNVSELVFDKEYELHLETIYQSLIGSGFLSRIGVWFSGQWIYNEAVTFLAKNCKTELGNIGGACLRKDANHIFVLLSNKEIEEILSEEDKSDEIQYVWLDGYPEGHNYDDVVFAAIINDTKFVQISASSSPNDVERSLLEGTASQNAAGEVLFFDSLDPENGKLSDDIVAAINSLFEYEQKDLKMELILPDSSETFDKYLLRCDMDVSFKTLRAEPEDGVEKMDETTFFGVKKGTEVTYEVNFDEVSCYDGAWAEDDSVKTYYLYPQLKSDDKVISTKVIQVKVYPVRCE